MCRNIHVPHRSGTKYQHSLWDMRHQSLFEGWESQWVSLVTTDPTYQTSPSQANPYVSCWQNPTLSRKWWFLISLLSYNHRTQFISFFGDQSPLSKTCKNVQSSAIREWLNPLGKPCKDNKEQKKIGSGQAHHWFPNQAIQQNASTGHWQVCYARPRKLKSQTGNST